jgi:uncharacterized protein
MRRVVSLLSNIFVNYPFITLLGFIFFVVTAYFSASNLTINSNQIDLLPAEYKEVILTKKVVEMIGGNGFYILTLKTKDEKGMDKHLVKAFEYKHKGDTDNYKKELALADEVKNKNLDYYKSQEKKLKKVSNVLYKRLIQEKDLIRYISYRYDTEFMKDNLPLFIQTKDMLEVRNRVKQKIDDEVERLSPLYMDISGEEYIPDFSDILSKYQKLAKRDIFDEYNISSDKGMLIMLIKPTGTFIDIGFIKKFDIRINEILSEYKLAERGIYTGSTGTYKLNLDDYESIVTALKPISIASLVGIGLLLLLFFRNPIFIVMLLVSLTTGILLTFGITYYTIGRLNTVTSIMAAILMGLGIDYGIQFLYRFREEFTHRGDLLESVKETVYHTGIASLSSALTTTSAFVVLMFSDFKGFSEFGFIACYGIAIIAFCMYFVNALQISILLKLFPSAKKMFIVQEDRASRQFWKHLYSRHGFSFAITLIVVTILMLFSYKVEFNYSGRELLLEDQESLLLYDEIGDRFDISSDPQVIVVDTLEEAEALFDYFNPMPSKLSDTIDQVVSVFSFLPPIYQQKENLKVLSTIKKDIQIIKEEDIKPEYKKYLPQVNKYLSAEAYTMDKIPVIFTKPFQEVPTSKEKGKMLFIYPKIALWHGKDLFRFHDSVGDIEYPVISRRTVLSILYHALSKDNKNNEPILLESSYELPKEQEGILLDEINSIDEATLLSLGILPETAKFIIYKRPFYNLNEIYSIKKKAYTVGSVILFAKLAHIVQEEGYISSIVTTFLVFIILVIFYRSFIAALFSLIPLVIGLLVMLGVMAILSVKINFFNVLVFPIIVGYGIQNGIYIYYRYMEEGDITNAISKVAPALTASTFTTLVGWSVLLIAKHRGLESLGIIACIGIASSLLIALFFLPYLLKRIHKTNKLPHTIVTDVHIEDKLPSLETTNKTLLLTETEQDKALVSQFDIPNTNIVTETKVETKEESIASLSDLSASSVTDTDNNKLSTTPLKKKVSKKKSSPKKHYDI